MCRTKHGAKSNERTAHPGGFFIVRAFVFALLVFPCSLYAVDLRVEHSIDPGTCKVGDRLTYTVRILAGPGLRLSDERSPKIDARLFKIVSSIQDRTPEKSGENRIWEDKYILVPRRVGVLAIPPYELPYFDAGERSLTESTGIPIAVTVEPLSGSETPPEDLFDIRENIAVKKPFPGWTWYLGAGVLVAAVLTALIVRRLRNRPPKPVVVRLITPVEKALAALKELRNDPIVHDGNSEEFSIRVSEIIRVYILERWAIDAVDKTTAETMENIQHHPKVSEYKKEFARFFESCDLVKFAGDLFQWNDFQVVVDEAKDLVEITASEPDVPDVLVGGPETDVGKGVGE